MPSDPIPHSPAAQMADLDRRRAARAELRALLGSPGELGRVLAALPDLLDDLDRHEREAAAEAGHWAALERERDNAIGAHQMVLGEMLTLERERDEALAAQDAAEDALGQLMDVAARLEHERDTAHPAGVAEGVAQERARVAGLLDAEITRLTEAAGRLRSRMPTRLDHHIEALAHMARRIARGDRAAEEER